MNKNNAGFLAVLGVVVAAAIGAFFVAPAYFKLGGETASDSAPASSLVGNGATTPEAPSSEAAETASADPAAGAGVDSWVSPSFDVLRVEPDGSTVIAGRAQPGTTLDIMNGDTVIASTAVSANGDFAAVLDKPLAAGDYQLTLRTAGEGGASRVSEEVATVSIPKDGSGELLAMVSKPGKASRIIAQPEAPQTGTEADTAAEAPAAPAATETAAAPQATETAAEAAAALEPTSPQQATETAAETAAAPEPAQPQQAAEAVATAGGAPETVQTPQLPAASSLLTTSAPEIAVTSEAAQPSETAAATDKATEIAAATPETVADAAPPRLPAGATVRVDAVEIEGDRIFIAGSATPGSTVRISADGVVIGADTADEGGRFIIEATSPLAVGDHIISADLMDGAGQEVLLRATVPFNRPEGDMLAAVAPAEPAASVASPAAAAPDMMIVPDIASLSKMREESFQALSTLEQLLAAPGTPDAAAVSAAFEEAVAKLRAAATADLPAGSSAEAMEIAQSMRAQAEAALAVILPDAAQGTASAPDVAGMLADPVKMGDMLSQAEAALSQPASITVAAANAPQPVADGAGQSGEPRTIVQAPLASTPGAVIIRRGDTLWQISRRTYGQGVRYTTIYVANRSQIQDPDRIKPGQVFSVPEKPLENAEDLHKQLLDAGKNP